MGQQERIVHFQKAGEGSPLVILHGLFGSGKNWQGIVQELKSDYTVYTLDARNHGLSFHSDTHTVEDMVNDLEAFRESENIEEMYLIGHSMGGLVAMQYVLHYPQYVKALVVVDIAPRSYAIPYEKEFAALQMDVSQFTTRKDLDAEMSKILPNQSIRQFLQTSLVREDQGFRWLLNVPVLYRDRDKRSAFPEVNLTWEGKVLFVRGGASPFMNDADDVLIHKYFPAATVEILQDADHWLHFTRAVYFLKVVRTFLTAADA